jgi:hypothetical protein
VNAKSVHVLTTFLLDSLYSSSGRETIQKVSFSIYIFKLFLDNTKAQEFYLVLTDNNTKGILHCRNINAGR